MIKKLALMALAAGTIAIALPQPTAEARSRGVSVHRQGPVHFRPQHFRPQHFRRHHFAPIYAYSYVSPFYYDNDCYWLKRRAINTGSRYWWRRYRECRGW